MFMKRLRAAVLGAAIGVSGGLAAAATTDQGSAEAVGGCRVWRSYYAQVVSSSCPSYSLWHRPFVRCSDGRFISGRTKYGGSVSSVACLDGTWIVSYGFSSGWR